MLWMLGLAAAAGVLSIFASPRVMGRVAGTAFVAAVAVALAIPVSRLLDDEKKKAAGLVGLLGVTVAFVVALASIWIDLFISGWQTQSRLALTAVIVCIGSLVAAGFLAQLRYAAMRATVAIGTLADLAACACFLGAAWDNFSEMLAKTGGAIVASGLPAALCLIGTPAHTRPWRWVGVLAAAVALPMAIAGIWFVPSKDPSLYITLLCIAVIAAHANVVSIIPLGDSGAWARPAAIGSMAATGACVSALAFITQGFDSTGPDLLTRVTGALGIVTACSTVGLAILYRLNRRPPGAAERASEVSAVQLTCPHCARKFLAPVNGCACPACGMLFLIKVTEPRCIKCEYPLLDIKGPVCPECGTPRPAAPPA